MSTDQRAALAKLRHDLRGILSPLLLGADRLTRHDDPVVRRFADLALAVVDRATKRLAVDETAGDPPAEDRS